MNNLLKIDFIQIGDFKTGTSWMQKYAYPLHPEIYYLGGPFKNQQYEKILHELIDSRDLDFNPEKIYTDFQSLILKEETGVLKKGICREAFTSDFISGDNARRNAERLHAVFGKTKIIFIIREQFSMLASIYSEYIKIGGTLSISKFIHDPIVSKGLVERLKWHKIINTYIEIFGKDNVFIGLFEEFKEDKGSFLRKIYIHIGCEDVEFIPKNNNVVNKGLTTWGGQFLRIANLFFRSHYNNSAQLINFGKLIGLFLSARKKRDLLEDNTRRTVPNYGDIDKKERMDYALNWWCIRQLSKIGGGIVIGEKIKVPEKIKKELKPQFTASNKILKNELNINIEKYNYSL